MIVLFVGRECWAAIGYQMVMPVCLFLGEHHSQSLLRSIHFQVESPSCSQQRPEWGCSCRLILMPGRLPGCLQKATSHSDFLLAPSPCQVFIQCLSNPCEAFYESPVMAYEAKEGSNFYTGLQWHAHSAIAFKFAVTRLDTLFRYSMCQVVYLFLKKTTLRHGFSLRLYSLS